MKTVLLVQAWPKSRRCLLSVLLSAMAGLAFAHDFRTGDLVINHPYAVPSVGVHSSAALYFKSIRNRGDAPDRLLSAATPVAARVTFHTMQMEGEVMKMRVIPVVELPAHGEVRMMHGSQDGQHLMLEGLQAPLHEGDRFPVTLQFEKAGRQDVQVWVQNPRNAAGHTH